MGAVVARAIGAGAYLQMPSALNCQPYADGDCATALVCHFCGVRKPWLAGADVSANGAVDGHGVRVREYQVELELFRKRMLQ